MGLDLAEGAGKGAAALRQTLRSPGRLAGGIVRRLLTLAGPDTFVTEKLLPAGAAYPDLGELARRRWVAVLRVAFPALLTAVLLGTAAGCHVPDGASWPSLGLLAVAALFFAQFPLEGWALWLALGVGAIVNVFYLLGAAAASTGAVGLFHVVGRTPEAPDLATAGGGAAPTRRIVVTAEMLARSRAHLSTRELAPGVAIDAVAIGSPHLSREELRRLAAVFAGRRTRVPFFACTGRHAIEALAGDGTLTTLRAAGVTIVADTCVVVTPILADGIGLVMTNSGKFAHYMKPNTGSDVVFGTLADCVESATGGRLVRDTALWR